MIATKAKRRDWNAAERTSRQLVRLMLTVDMLRSAGQLTLGDLVAMDPLTSCRTYRRDLAVLTRMDWCVPAENDRGQTVWRWIKDS